MFCWQDVINVQGIREVWKACCISGQTNPCIKTECQQCHENLYHTVCVDNKISNQLWLADRLARVFTFYHVFAKAKKGLCCTPSVCLRMNKVQFLHSDPAVLGFFQLLSLDVRVGQASKKMYFETAVAWHKKS